MKLDFEKLESNINGAALQDFSENKVFGSCYAVYQKDNMLFKKCYGKVDVDGEEMRDSTVFRMASMTKPITALATLILADRGKLCLCDGISKYLPQFKNIHITDADKNDMGKPKSDPTIKDILSHCSGIGSDFAKFEKMTAKDKATLDNSIDFYAGIGLDYEPKTKQAYSPTSAFDVLIKIIEKVTGTDYLTFLKKEIFEPCNMPDTTFVPNAEQWRRTVAMHNRVNGKNVSEEMPKGCVFEDYPCTHYLGGAGLVSTLNDYLNFAKMLLNGGNANGKQLVSEELFKQMHTVQISKDIMPGDERWGLGVRVIAEAEYPYLPVGTYGWSGAYGSHFWVDPVNEIVAVFMKNSKIDGGSGNKSSRKFEEAVYKSFAE